MVLIRNISRYRDGAPQEDKAAKLETFQTTQIIRNAADDVLVAELEKPQACVKVPPKEDKAYNLEELFLDPETQPGEARDGVNKVKAATTDHADDGWPPCSYQL